MHNYNSFFLFLYSICLFTQAPSAQAAYPQEVVIKINSLSSAYAITQIKDENLPTLILLPGIFRGFLLNEEVLSVLSRRKMNWVAWHTSRHPESLISGGQPPWQYQVTSQDLARELLVLKKTLRIKMPILVSLSYSASLIPFLSTHEFPSVIETAPMGTALENNPPPAYYKNWLSWMSLFPVFGQLAIQYQEFWAYRGYWFQQTQNLTSDHPEYMSKQTEIAEGLAQLAYASRDFDLRKQDYSKGPRRFWILGKKENKIRKAIQLEAIQSYENQTGHYNSAYVVENAGHIIPNENPEDYVKILAQIVQKLAK